MFVVRLLALSRVFFSMVSMFLALPLMSEFFGRSEMLHSVLLCGSTFSSHHALLSVPQQREIDSCFANWQLQLRSVGDGILLEFRRTQVAGFSRVIL
jgi:hypothetical protein